MQGATVVKKKDLDDFENEDVHVCPLDLLLCMSEACLTANPVGGFCSHAIATVYVSMRARDCRNKYLWLISWFYWIFSMRWEA